MKQSHLLLDDSIGEHRIKFTRFLFLFLPRPRPSEDCVLLLQGQPSPGECVHQETCRYTDKVELGLITFDLNIRYCRRDQKIPMIWFVANSGGILGLCMGFSMVTVWKK